MFGILKNLFISKETNISILFFLIFITCSHLLFSRYGFNPTDEGLMLALSRRILEGQIPHLDFISIRPVGSPFFHTIDLILFKDKLYFYSRLLVFIEFYLISFFWIKIINDTYNKILSTININILILISTMLCIHSFHLLAWATIDGIFFISFGMYLIVTKNKLFRPLGFFLIGYSLLCKQSFFVIPIITLLIFENFKDIKAYIFLALPGFIYLFLITMLGGYADFIDQMISEDNLEKMETITRQFKNSYGILTGYIIGFSLSYFYNSYSTKEKITKVRIFSYIQILLILILFALLLLKLLGIFISSKIYGGGNEGAFFLYGVILSIILFEIFDTKDKKLIYIALFLIFLGWSVSLSDGYRSPALIGGLFFSFILFHIIFKLGIKFHSTIIVLAIMSFGIGIQFYEDRTKLIYRNLPSKFLNYNLSGILPGASGVFTDENTFFSIQDLNNLINKYSNKNFSIVPDFAGFWPASDQINPLPIDWAQPVEMPFGKPFEKTKKSLIKFLNNGNVVFVQKFSAVDLSSGIFDIRNSKSDDYYIGDNNLLAFIEKNFKIVDETKFFFVYAKADN